MALKYVDFVIDDNITFSGSGKWDYHVLGAVCLLCGTCSIVYDDFSSMVNMAVALGVLAACKIDDPLYMFFTLVTGVVYIYKSCMRLDTPFKLTIYDLLVTALLYFVNEVADHWADSRDATQRGSKQKEDISILILRKVADFRVFPDFAIPYYMIFRQQPTAAAVIFGTRGYEIGRELFVWYVKSRQVVEWAVPLGIPLNDEAAVRRKLDDIVDDAIGDTSSESEEESLLSEDVL